MLPMLQPELWTATVWVDDVEPAGIQDVVPSPTGTTRLDRRGQRWLFVKGRLKGEEQNPIVRSFIHIYRPVLTWIMLALGWRAMFVVLGAVCAIMGFVKMTSPE